MSNATHENEGSNPQLEVLAQRIADLIEEDSYEQLRSLLDEGVAPEHLLDACMEGMRRVGLRFEAGEYYISALIMAGEIMRVATEILRPHLVTSSSRHKRGKALVGTIKGDIHDLGKNLFIFMLTCHGFDVVDLGVDVPVEDFLEKATQEPFDVIGLSCLMTTSIDTLKDAVEKLREQQASHNAQVVIGGTCLDASVADYIGAENWAQDAASGLRICERILRKKSEKPIS